jgi:hypothetical protein
MIKYWILSDKIRGKVFIPKYYNPEIDARLEELRTTHDLLSMRELLEAGVLSSDTGHEIGKNAYGTGDIPFVRTSDIANWEIKTAPKQGVSKDIYEEYSTDQDVQEGDILVVRDGTYLIGTNCFVTKVDKELVYQSHLLKLRVNRKAALDPHLLFLALNSRIVQNQFRSFQFTADIIDTIGARFFDTILAIPRAETIQTSLVARTAAALNARMLGKAFVKYCPVIMQEVLASGSTAALDRYLSASPDEVVALLRQEAVTSEFGEFEHFWLNSDAIKDAILIPKYYEPSIQIELTKLTPHCELVSLGELRDRGIVEYQTGDEIGKLAYGTGRYPFLRTSDFANWEIKHDPKHGVAREIYESYAVRQDVRANDILLVRDGTYLVGSSCIITPEDTSCLFCGGLFKIRAVQEDVLDPFLLLGLLNSYIVKRQIRTKQFTRDVIDTLGNRLDEIMLPIPKASGTRMAISSAIRNMIESRIAARHTIASLAAELEHGSAALAA